MYRLRLQALCCLLLVRQTLGKGVLRHLEVGDQVPLSKLDTTFEPCYPPEAGTELKLSQYDFTQNGGSKFVTVVGHYYTGCTPGRDDAPAYAQTASMLAEINPGKVSFMMSLKNGVNNGICESWANLGGDYSKGLPIVINDHDRVLMYTFFEGPAHPQYVVLDHCMTVRYRLDKLTSNQAMVDAVNDLLGKFDEPCAERTDTYTPAAPLTPGTSTALPTCVPQLGSEFSIERLDLGGMLSYPRDVKFHPVTGDMWVANNHTDGMVIAGDPLHADTHTPQFHADRAHYHYMDRISSFSFGPFGDFATCQESENNYDEQKKPNRFMGPSMYDSVQPEGKLPIFVDQMGQQCDLLESGDKTCFFTHSDMLHACPLCMGIGHDPAQSTLHQNVYFLFDGLHGTLMRFDFESPHYPGSLDHSLASVRRFPEIELHRVPGVVGHIVVDDDPHNHNLYIADTGGDRVIVMDADSGRFNQHARNDLGGNYSIWSSDASSFEYSEYTCARHKVIAEVERPSGIAVHGNMLFVVSHAKKELVVVHKTTGEHIQTVSLAAAASGAANEGIMGISVEPGTGRLWFTDAPSNTVSYLDVTAPCAAESATEPAAPVDYPAVDCPTPAHNALGRAVALPHEDGYLNMTMLGAEYGESESCLACDDDCDNDMLLMSGYLCHICLPEPCLNGGTCENFIMEGYKCSCPEGFTGDHCQFAPVSPTSSPTSSPTDSPTSSPTDSPTGSPTTAAPTAEEATATPTAEEATEAPTESDTSESPSKYEGFDDSGAGQTESGARPSHLVKHFIGTMLAVAVIQVLRSATAL